MAEPSLERELEPMVVAVALRGYVGATNPKVGKWNKSGAVRADGEDLVCLVQPWAGQEMVRRVPNISELDTLVGSQLVLERKVVLLRILRLVILLKTLQT